MTNNSEKWVHPTVFTGDWPNWNGFTFLDWHQSNNVYHPGDDYNKGSGNDDFGQDAGATSSGVVIHTSKSTTGYGPIVIVKHTLGYNLRRFIKETYGIETDSLYSLYAHLKDIFVNVGDVVEVGQRIGTVGKGGTTWAHLHFEIYAPIGELAEKGWRFYPTGWKPEKIKEFWLPAYKFIESTKNLESYQTFLGKPKDYWLTVEKDRISLIEQLTQKDIDWAKKVETASSGVKQLTEDIAKIEKLAEKAQISYKKEVKNFTTKITNLETANQTLKTENTQLLENNAENIRFMSALKLVVFTISNMFKKGGGIKND